MLISSDVTLAEPFGGAVRISIFRLARHSELPAQLPYREMVAQRKAHKSLFLFHR